MRTPSFAGWSAALAVAALLTVTPALAAPVPSGTVALKSAVASPLTDVRWRHRGWHGGGVGAGLATGLLLGGIIGASPYYYGGPPAYYGPPVYYRPRYYAPAYGYRYGGRDWLDYCFSRYRSFDPRSGTYMGYDGRRHYCR